MAKFCFVGKNGGSVLHWVHVYGMTYVMLDGKHWGKMAPLPWQGGAGGEWSSWERWMVPVKRVAATATALNGVRRSDD